MPDEQQPVAGGDAADDDTVLTEEHEPIEDTAPVIVRRAQTHSQAKFTPGRALPPQSPPVTDVHLLEFRPPEVPSGGVVRYRVRTTLEVTELPDFDAEWRVRQREPRAIAASDIIAHQLDGRRAWYRRAVLTVTIVTALAVALGAAGLWALARL